MQLTLRLRSWREGSIAQQCDSIEVYGLRLLSPDGLPVRLSQWSRGPSRGLSLLGARVACNPKRVDLRTTRKGKTITLLRVELLSSEAEALLLLARQKRWTPAPLYRGAKPTDLEKLYAAGRPLSLERRDREHRDQQRQFRAQRAAYGKPPLRGQWR